MKISIITSTYNQKEYLKQTIESVQKSIFIPHLDIEWEHIIYDDASTDGTAEIFKENSWINVVYIKGEQNKGGPSFGRNHAINIAKGDYIFMIDHDDIILQRTLFTFVEYAKKYPDTTWFVADFLRVDSDLKYMIGNDYFGWKFTNIKEMLSAIFRGEHFMQSSVFFKKELFFEAGGFDEKRPVDQDLDLFVRFLLNGHMPIYCNFHTHLHRMHEKNLSGNMGLQEHIINIKSLKEKYKDELQKQGII